MASGKKLRIWVLRQGEPVVFHPDMRGHKPMRTALLARELARRGHEVVWWTSAFQHFTKSHLEPAGRLLEADVPGLRYYLLPSPGYRRNVSLMRYHDHVILMRNWERAVAAMAPPDVIVTAYPQVELSYAAVRYALRHRVPVIVDVRDLWPEVIYERLRRKLRLPLMPRFLRSYERMCRFIFTNATAIMGITNAFVDWALRCAGRQRTELDRTFLLSSDPLRNLSPEERDAAKLYWRNKLPGGFGEQVTFAWIGTLLDTAASHDFLRAVATLPPDVATRLRVVICGRGALEGEVRELASQCRHVVYGGWADRAGLAYLLSNADYGVIPYDRSRDFQCSVPNKVSEYLSAGAHVLTTLDGQVRELLEPFGVVRIMRPEVSDMRDMLMRLTGEGKLPPRERGRAQECYHRLFDSAVIYPAMAEYVEQVALCGARACPP